MNDTADEMPGIEIDNGDLDARSPDSDQNSNTPTATEMLERANNLFQVDEATMAEIADPDWITPNLFIRSHMVVIAAEPNGGKTTIVFDCCKAIVRDGFDVYYVNADTAGPEAKQMYAEAKEAGINLWLPDFAPGQSMESFILMSKRLANALGRLDKVVIVVDTLKKMLDMTSKSAARE